MLRVRVRRELTMQVCDMACSLWGLSDSDSYALCEVSVVHGGLAKQTTLRDPIDNLAASLGCAAMAMGVFSLTLT